MAAGRYSSRVFVAGRALYDRLAGTQFPPHPALDTPPSVEFGDERPGEVAEAIVLALTPDESRIEWRRLSPPGADEALQFTVTIHSYVPSVATSAEVWDRLEQLADVVQSTLLSTATEQVVPLGFPGELAVGHAVAVRPSVAATETGWIGRCVITLALMASI